MIFDATIPHGQPGGFPCYCYVEDADGWRLPITKWVNTETGEAVHYRVFAGGQIRLSDNGSTLATYRETFKAPLRFVPLAKRVAS